MRSRAGSGTQRTESEHSEAASEGTREMSLRVDSIVHPVGWEAVFAG